MESFTIILNNDRLGSYRRIAIFILLLHFFFFIYYLLKVEINISVIAGLVISIMAILYLFIAEKISRKRRIPAGVSFILLAIIWLWFQHYWLVASLFLLAFLDLMSGKKTVLLFFQDKIEIRGFPKKIIHWNELNNAILKDHILTLDLKNDHLIQGEIAAESFVIDENDFNLFCLQQLQNKT